jgi:lysophospholipase L1-like esterase
MDLLVLIVTLPVALFIGDTIIRFIYIFWLRAKIRRRGNHRARVIESGNGRRLNVAMLGDSVLYGESSEYELPALSHVVHDLSAKDYHVMVRNYAVTGHTLAELTTKQLPQAVAADLIFIYIGANDYFKFNSPKKYAQAVEDLLDKLTGKTVIWCTLADPRYLYPLPIWLRAIYYRYAVAYTRSVESIIHAHSGEQWYVIDFLNEARRRIISQKLNKRDLLSDGFHLSTLGHELWGKVVADGYKSLKRRHTNLP